MAARDPVITGFGIIAASGNNGEAVWRAITNNADGLKPLTLFESPRYGPVPVGEIREDLVALGAPKKVSRSDQLGWLAAREAIKSSGLESHDCGDRAGVLLGCSVGGSFNSEIFLSSLIKHGSMRPSATRYHECFSTVELIADTFGFFGPGFAVATACSSGALAIATAAELIQSGQADVMLAGGADSLCRMTWGGFHSLLLVDSAGCRPFDVTRGGMSLGEGAAVIILETEETAIRRGAKILARLSGWGASCDAYHATAPHPEGAGALAAMQSALRRADLDAQSINYINAHGTGTRDNDLAEAKAMKKVFGENVPPFSSTKRFFGHTLAASGAIEAVVCIEALRRGEIPPNPGFTSVDPAVGLAPVTKLQRSRLTHVMSNSFGFGGNNASLIFSSPEVESPKRMTKTCRLSITGLGVIGAGAKVVRDIEPPLPSGRILTHDCGPLADAATLTPNQRRRLSRMTQMALLAARRAGASDKTRRLSVAIGTGFGCLAEGAIFIENLISKDEREPTPMHFPGSVHNAPAAQIAIDLAARGLNSAPTAAEISFEAALWQSVSQLAADETDDALAGAVDELNKFPLAIGKRWKIWNDKAIPGEGAAVVRLSREGSGGAPIAQLTGVHLGRWRKPFDASCEAKWIASVVDLATVACVVTGSHGWPMLDGYYAAVMAELSRLAGRQLSHETYKELCGEFYSASAFGFTRAVEVARQRDCAVLLYTLSPRGGKAVCCVQR